MTAVAPHPFEQLLEIDRRCRGRVLSGTLDTAMMVGPAGALGVRLAQHCLLFPLGEISEVIPAPPTTRVPWAKSWLRGIANLRGTLISVVDLAEYLLGRPGAVGGRSRLVVIQADDWGCGLLVDEILGMRQWEGENRLAVPKGTEEGLQPYLTEAFQDDGKLWLGFSPTRLLQDPRFLSAAT